MAQLKTFNQFLNEEHKIDEKTNKIFKEKILPLMKEYEKFLSGKPYNEKIKNVLVIKNIRNHSHLIKEALEELKIENLWISGKFLNEEKFFQYVLRGNNRCVVFNDCEPSYLKNKYCQYILNNATPESGKFCSEIVPDKKTSIEKRSVFFRGVIIILTDSYDDNDKIENCEYIEL